MTLDDINGDNIPSRYSLVTDTIGVRSIGDTRKPSITLKAINRIKRIKSIENKENEQKTKLIGIMFGDNAAEETPQF